MKNKYNLTIYTSTEEAQGFINTVSDIVESFERNFEFDIEYNVDDEIAFCIENDQILIDLNMAFEQANRVPRLIEISFVLEKDGSIMNVTNWRQLKTSALQELNEELESELEVDLEEMMDLFTHLKEEHYKTFEYIYENRNEVINKLSNSNTEKL